MECMITILSSERTTGKKIFLYLPAYIYSLFIEGKHHEETQLSLFPRRAGREGQMTVSFIKTMPGGRGDLRLKWPN